MPSEEETAVTQHRIHWKDLPEDWDEDDVEHLALFLSDHDLGELTAVVNPEDEADFVLTIVEDDDRAPTPLPNTFDSAPGRPLTTGSTELDTGPQITKEDMERLKREPISSGAPRRGDTDE